MPPSTFRRAVLSDRFGSCRIRYKLNKIMSRQENTPNRSQPTAVTTPVSRITRTNPNSNQRLVSNSSLLTDPTPSAEEIFKLSLLPSKPSALDKNIMFQDMDHTRTSTYQSTNASRTNNGPTSSSLEGDKTMGLISNVFLGTTNKFMRGANNNAPIPATTEQPEQQPQDMNKGTPVKFSRNKDTEQKTRTISMKEPPQESVQATDRSMETGKKIERRQGASREIRELKFAVEKKQEKIESTPEKVGPTVVLSARRYQATKVQNIKTEAVKVQQPVEDFPRVYQPIQRQNPYARSRLVSEQQPPATATVTQPAEQKPKEEPVPAKPVNRLVQSRLQAQLSESKVSERQVKPVTTLNRGSESRFVAELTVTEPAVQPKQQAKPKPYSRSFVSRKPEPQPYSTSVQTTINQSTIKQTLQPPTRAVLQQSKISEVKAKPQVKEALPQASDAKVILKKSGCIALIGKRLIKSRLQEGFALLKSHRQADKSKKINQCQIVCCAMTTIVRVKEANLLKMSFEAMKRKFSTAYIVSLKSYADEAPENHKNAGLLLLDHLYCSKMRTNFKVLKTSLERFRNRAKCVVAIESLYKQKVKNHMKRSFENIKIRQKSNILALHNLSTVFNSVNKIKVASAFSKIAAVKPVLAKIQTSPAKQQPQRSRIASKVQQPASVVNDTSNQALIDKLQKLKKATSVAQSEITSVEASIAKKKKSAENEKGGLLEKVTVLKHQNQQVNNEVEIKKHRSGQIKQEMETIPKKHRELEEELTEPPQNKLEILTNIYISHFKNAEETIATADLQSAYNLKVQDGSVLFHEWASILRNVELKRVIAAYEGVDPRDNKGRANLISEQTLISRLIRSYVKEQYFWQWIHLSAQNG